MTRAAPSTVARLKCLAVAAEAELQENIIPFWLRLRDPSGNGFAGAASHRGHILPSAVKGAVLHSRILWFFSASYMMFGDTRFLDAAKCAYRFIAECLIDRDAGGVFWTTNWNGFPRDTRKHLYAQAFAILGLSAFYRATGDAQALSLGFQICETVETKATRRDGYGYLEAFSREWQLIDNEQMFRADATQTFNAHLHLAEAYGALWQVSPEHVLGQRLETLLALLTDSYLDRANSTFRQAFNSDNRCVAEGPSYGHDIEASWLIPALYDLLPSGVSACCAEKISTIAEAVLHNGLGADGSVASGLDVTGKRETARSWWVQAEALVGFLDAFERRGELRYLDAAERVWGYINQHVIDRENGEWLEYVNPERVARLNRPKAHKWKGPYHNGRACLDIIFRARQLSSQKISPHGKSGEV